MRTTTLSKIFNGLVHKSLKPINPMNNNVRLKYYINGNININPDATLGNLVDMNNKIYINLLVEI